MDMVAYKRCVIWSLGCFLMCGLGNAALPQEPGKSKAHESQKPALYNPKADARAQIEAALAKAKRDHARVLGGVDAQAAVEPGEQVADALRVVTHRHAVLVGRGGAGSGRGQASQRGGRGPPGTAGCS